MYTKNFASSVLLLVLSYDASAFTFPSSKSQPELKSSTVGIQSDTYNIQGSTNEDLSRRDIFSHSLNAILAASAALAPRTANAVVVQSGPCASGEGAACENLADGNEFILSLQKKSATNREKNEKVSYSYTLWFKCESFCVGFCILIPFLFLSTSGSLTCLQYEELP